MAAGGKDLDPAITQPTTQNTKGNFPIGYECEFVEPPPKILTTECSICLQIPRNPHQVSCCGQRLCKSCIERTWSENKPCPLCNQLDFTATLDKNVQRHLSDLKVYCTNKEQGCEWVGELRHLDHHLNANPRSDEELTGCEFVELSCKHGCGGRFQRSSLTEHHNNCPSRPFSCEYCNHVSTYRDVVTNHWVECPKCPLQCPNSCEDSPIERQNLKYHLNKECPLGKVSCEFQYAGCTAHLQRRDMAAHMRDYTPQHISLLSSTIRILAADIRDGIRQQETEGVVKQEQAEAKARQKERERKLQKIKEKFDSWENLTTMEQRQQETVEKQEQVKTQQGDLVHEENQAESKGYFRSTTPQEFGSQYIMETFVPQEQALTVDNVLRAVENVKNWRDLGQRLRVPRSKVVEIDKLYSTDKEKMKAVVEYWWRVDPSPSWRMVIRALDWADETDAADRIKPNAERLADDSLNLNSVIRALAKVKDWDSFGQTLGVVYSRREVIRERYSSKDQRKEATWSYWLQYMPEVSWNELASKLYYKEEFTALQAVLPYVHKTTERTLTLTNLRKVLEAVRDWKGFGRCLFIPKSKLDEISKQYSDPDQCKQEMIKEWLCINSTPSWIAVAEALFRWGLKESDLHGSPLRTVMTYARGVTPVSPTLPTLLPHHRRDPRFPGIIFYGDPILKMVGSDGCKLAWPEIGICLHFPPNTVPDGKALHLTIWPCLSGPFVPPEGREFSSPVYLISPAFHFQEDVELSINHFENLRCQEDVASMSFATTLSSKEIHTSKPVYTFESLGKGDFKVTSSVGTINLRHFCRNEFCQVAATRKRQRCSQDDEPEAERTTKRSKEEHSYCVQLHQSTSPQHPSYAVFAVSLYQELYLSNLASNLICQFPDHHFRMQPKQPVYISGDAVELEIRQVEGWSMIPSILPAKISQKEVDLALFDPNCKVLSASYPPKFHVTIKPGAQATDTVCVLPVRGLQEELSFPMALSLSARSPHAMHEHSQGMTADANTSMNKGRTTKMLLTINDRTKVMKYLRRISSVQTLLMVGEFLGVDGRKFAKNKTADTFLFDLVGDWLSRTYKVDEKGIPSWRKLMEVLEEVDEMGLANDIRKDLGLAVPLPAAPAAPAALEVSKAVQTDGEREVQTEPWSTTKHFLYSLPGSAYRLLKGVPLLLLIVALSLFIILIIIQLHHAFNDHADYCPSD